MALVSDGGEVETRSLGSHRMRAHKLAIDPSSSFQFMSSAEDGIVNRYDLRQPGRPVFSFMCEVEKLRQRGGNGDEDGDGDEREVEVMGLNTINSHPLNPNVFAVAGDSPQVLEYDLRMIGNREGGGEAGVIRMVRPCRRFLPGESGVTATSNTFRSRHHITCLAYSVTGGELLATYSGGKILKFDSSPSSKGEDNALLQVYRGLSNPKPFPLIIDVFYFSHSKSFGVSFFQLFCNAGHRNMRTVKSVNFYGPESEFVVSGSDCGHIFLWESKSGRIRQVMKGDRDVVNVLEPHPFDLTLATSGIESDIKIWTPTSETKFVMTEEIQKVFLACSCISSPIHVLAITLVD